MKLTQEQKTNIYERADMDKLTFIYFDCYADGIFTYIAKMTEEVILQVGLIPQDREETFMRVERLGEFLDRDFLYFDGGLFELDEEENGDAIKTGMFEIININTNNLN